MCQKCHNGFFLFYGECISPEECYTKGKFPLGSTGGVCHNAGYSCSKSTDPDCSPPTSLGDACGAFKVKNSGAIECTECDTTLAWFTKGACNSQRTCKRRRFTDNGGKCDCQEQRPDGSIEKYCGTCTLSKVMPSTNNKGFKPTTSSQYRDCTSCRKKRVLQDAVCMDAASVVCPAWEVMYSAGVSGASCEIPFSCDTGERSDGPEVGEKCGCLVPNLCQQCDWGKNDTPYACTVCKKHHYLLNGECITSDACIFSGGIPNRGNGPRGGVCKA